VGIRRPNPGAKMLVGAGDANGRAPLARQTPALQVA